MSTTSVIVEHEKIQGHEITHEPGAVAEEEKGEKHHHKFDYIKRRLYHHLMETIRSILIIGGVLTLYKVAGVHSLWLQLVETFM